MTTLEEYMAMPEDKPYRELLDGQVIEKCMGYWAQQGVVTQLLFELYEYATANGVRRPLSYLSVSDATQRWVFVPAISWYTRERMPWRTGDTPHPIPVLPNFVVESLGEGEDTAWFLRRICHYLNHGVELVWVFDPAAERLTQWRPEAAPTEHIAPERVRAEPVLPGFELDLAAFFERARSSPVRMLTRVPVREAR